MAVTNDRVGELLDGLKRHRRQLVTPEGVPLDIQIAGNGERITAFALDMFFMFMAMVVISLFLHLLVFTRFNLSIGYTLAAFLAFLVRVLYFIHFELAWQGRTPGKKICGLRVINRRGGELTPMAIIARNLTREVEVFLPIGLFFSLGYYGNFLQDMALLGWVLILAGLPLFNRGHLRAGDLIGGTQVISMPKRMLLGDLTTQPKTRPQGDNVADVPERSFAYNFTHEQLAIYGNFELQVLEELLRRPPHKETEATLKEVCEKICKKIGWEEPVPPAEVRRFLNEFYTAERANLERGQLFGKLKSDKNTKV